MTGVGCMPVYGATPVPGSPGQVVLRRRMAQPAVDHARGGGERVRLAWPASRICRTPMPRTPGRSAISRRWRRHHGASAHVSAVRRRAASSSKRARPSANSALSRRSAWPCKAALRQRPLEEPGCARRRPPNCGNHRYSPPAAGRVRARVRPANHGWRREPGKRRTSATAWIPQPVSSARKSSPAAGGVAEGPERDGVFHVGRSSPVPCRDAWRRGRCGHCGSRTAGRLRCNGARGPCTPCRGHAPG